MSFLFSKPLPFEEAIQSREVRQLLPTDFRTALLQQIPAELRERAFFSAGVTNAQFLEEASKKIDALVAGKTDRATMRLELKQLLDSLGYRSPEGEEGTLTDLSSDDRLNLILDTNLEMAQGYGHWKQGQDPAVLDAWPAQELVRFIETKEQRDWESRWGDAGGQFWGGRMIALKNDPIWVAISRFGLPYPPFDFNSGMDVADIDRDEAEEIGLIDRATQITPQDRGFNEGLEASLGVGDDIAAAVQGLFGDRASVLDGVLRWVGGAL
jgi:hypothetical protein